MSFAPARAANVTSPSSMSASEEPSCQCQDQQRIERRDHIVPHDAQAALPAAIDGSDRRRFNDIEEPKKYEACSLPFECLRRKEKYAPHRNHLIPNHGAMVRRPEIAPRLLARPYAGDESTTDKPSAAGRPHPRLEHDKTDPTEKASEGAWRNGCQPTAATERDEMRGMRKKKTWAWARDASQSDQTPLDSCRSESDKVCRPNSRIPIRGPLRSCQYARVPRRPRDLRAAPLLASRAAP